jgi:hypothetical protein
MEGEVFASRDFDGAALEAAVVGARHIGPARAEVVVVYADQRVGEEEVDLVVDEHHVAGGVLRVEAAGGVGDDERVGAEGFQQAHE